MVHQWDILNLEYQKFSLSKTNKEYTIKSMYVAL